MEYEKSELDSVFDLKGISKSNKLKKNKKRNRMDTNNGANLLGLDGQRGDSLHYNESIRFQQDYEHWKSKDQNASDADTNSLYHVSVGKMSKNSKISGNKSD